MTIQIAREETRCRHYMGYSFRIAEWDVLYPPSHRQNSTYHALCYISRGVRAGTDIIAHITTFVTPVVEYWLELCKLSARRGSFVFL